VIVDEDPTLSDRVRLARDPAVFALGRLLLVAQGDTGAVARAAAAELGARGAVRVEHVTTSIGCLAVPIRDAHGHVAGALAFAGPRHRIVEPAAIISHLAPVAERIAPFVT
jgi:DNA-binding IclR family transcriptional regulator